MNAYRDMPDAELERKVLELMGYSVTKYGEGYAIYKDGQIVTGICWTRQIDALSNDAPNPLTDANVCMALVDEMEEMGCRTSIYGAKSDGYSVSSVDDERMVVIRRPSRARAVCEVYCMVKEGQK